MIDYAEPLARLLRRVGEMVEGYEAGGSVAMQMMIIRDEWRRYQGLPAREPTPKTVSTVPNERGQLVRATQMAYADLVYSNHTNEGYAEAKAAYERAHLALLNYDEEHPR